MKKTNVSNPIVEVLPFDSKDIPNVLRDYRQHAIQRSTHSGKLRFEFKIPVKNLLTFNATTTQELKANLFRFTLADAYKDSSKLDELLSLDNKNPMVLTDLTPTGWYHDSPFFLEVSCNQNQRSIRLNAHVHGQKADPRVLDQPYHANPALVCPPIFFSDHKPSNLIEEDIERSLSADMLAPVERESYFAGGDDATNTTITNFSFVTQESVRAATASKDKKVITPFGSLIGLVARMYGNVYPITLPNSHFDEEITHFLKMDRGVATNLNQLIGENAKAVTDGCLFTPENVEFAIKISSLAPNWEVSTDKNGVAVLRDANIDPGHARDISLDETITVKLDMFIQFLMRSPETSETPCAIDAFDQNLFFYRPWPVDALDAHGKPKVETDSNGKPVYVAMPGGRKAPVYRKPYQHINAINEPLGDVSDFIDKDPENPSSSFQRPKRIIVAPAPSSSSSSSSQNNLLDD